MAAWAPPGFQTPKRTWLVFCSRSVSSQRSTSCAISGPWPTRPSTIEATVSCLNVHHAVGLLAAPAAPQQMEMHYGHRCQNAARRSTPHHFDTLAIGSMEVHLGDAPSQQLAERMHAVPVHFN